MKQEHYLKKVVEAQKRGEAKGIYSVCSSNPYVIQAAVRQGVEDGSAVLIEATCNQVNQFGGYTGMTPQEYNDSVFSVADAVGLSREKLILGGDHLGPYPFRREKAEKAMALTREMVRAFVLAGCSKIHLDASHRVADDPEHDLSPKTISSRAADLCAEAERAFQELKERDPSALPPVYVIGTEVPAPGGSDEVEESLKITTVPDFEETVRLTKEAFFGLSLEAAWKRVVAVVVQPGVEHGNHIVIEYNRERVRELTSALKNHSEFVFEGHTSDYQTVKGLKAMVEDGIAILKTGQSQTAAVREAAFMLNYIEEELLGRRRGIMLSRFIETLDAVMKEDPKYWLGYYRKDEAEFDRKYSLFDRQRYYWSNQRVKESLECLFKNLRAQEIPQSLISQFLPEQYKKIRLGLLDPDPEEMLVDRAMDHMREYAYAVGNREMVYDWWC